MSSLNTQSEMSYCFGEFVFPSDSIIDVKRVNGMKEGKCKVFSKDKVLVAELSFHEDLLDGNCIFYNEKGDKTRQYIFDNEIEDVSYTFEGERVKEYSIRN